jgi:hypothetical protein
MIPDGEHLAARRTKTIQSLPLDLCCLLCHDKGCALFVLSLRSELILHL